MKHLFAPLALALIACSPSSVQNPYLGQTPPGIVPEQFAPGLISTDALEIEGVFAPGMREFYFTRQVDRGPVMSHGWRNEDGEWREFFAVERTGEISFSTDGRIMYLGNSYREREGDSWSDPKPLGRQFNDIEIMRLTASSEQTYVLDERDEIGTIRFSRLENGSREDPIAYGETINTGTFTAHPFIAPDESYLIWDSDRLGGYGDSDLYISFRQKDGTWGDAINMGPEINSSDEDAYGSITPDGKYFIFHRINLEVPRANIYWVDAKVIEGLRTQK